MSTTVIRTADFASEQEFSHTRQDGFPIIDYNKFEQDPSRTASEILDAASKWGFLVLEGHGIPQTEIDSMFATVMICFVELKEQVG